MEELYFNEEFMEETFSGPDDSSSDHEPVEENFIVEDEQVEVVDNEDSEIEEDIQDYTELVDKIDEVNNNVSDFKNEFISFSDDSSNDDYAETVSLSVNNIMTTPIQDYNLSESLLLVISLSLFVAGLIHIIKRSLPQWH